MDVDAPLGMDLEEAFKVVGEFGSYQKQAVAAIVVTQVGVCILAVISAVHLVTPQPTKKNVATWLLAELSVDPAGTKTFYCLNLLLIIDQTVTRAR